MIGLLGNYANLHPICELILFQWVEHFGNGQLILLSLNIKLVILLFPLKFLAREFTFPVCQVISELFHGQKIQAYCLGQNFFERASLWEVKSGGIQEIMKPALLLCGKGKKMNSTADPRLG